jgi:hypothetical protein
MKSDSIMKTFATLRRQQHGNGAHGRLGRRNLRI